MRQVIFLQGHPKARSLEKFEYPALTRRQTRIIKTATRFIKAVDPETQVSEILGPMLGIPVTFKHVETILVQGDELSGRIAATAGVIEIQNSAGEIFFMAADSACVAGICSLIAEQPLPRVILPRKAAVSELGVFASVTASLLWDCTGGSLRISRIPDSNSGIVEESMGPGGLWVEYAVCIDTLWGRLAAIFPASMAYPSSLQQISPLRAQKLLRGVVANISVETVPCLMELSMISSLEPDDIILFPAIQPDGSAFRLRAGRGGFPCRLTPENNIEILGEFIMADLNALEEKSDAVSASGKALMQELEVEAVVEVARTAVSAEDLIALTGGSVIRFDRPVSGPMDLRAGGKLIARGELVDIEGELGFRVLEVL